MGRTILLAALFCLSFFVQAQQSKIDSLLRVYENEKIDTLKIKTLKQICQAYYYSDNKAGRPYVDTLMRLSRQVKEFDGVNFGYRYIGSVLLQEGKFSEAIIEFEKSLNLMDSLGLEDKKYSDYTNIGNAHRYKRDFDKATNYYNKAIEIATRLNRKDRLIVINNNLGTMAYEQEKFEKSIDYFVKSLAFKEYNTNPNRIIGTYNGLGLVHYEINQLDKAIEYLNEALILSEKHEYAAGIADSKKNLAKCYTKQGNNIDLSIEHLNDAIGIYEHLKDYIFLLEAYSNLGEAYEVNNDLDNAILSHKQAVNLSENIQMQDKVFGSRVALGNAYVKQGDLLKADVELDYILNDTLNENLQEKLLVNAYKAKSELSKKRGDYKSAFIYHKRFKDLNDKIQSTEKIKDINELEIRYETEKKEKELVQQQEATKKQELIAEKANTLKWVFGIGILAIAFMSFFIWRKYKAEEKAKNTISQQKDEIESQKNLVEKLQQELHHRLKNDFRTINTFIRLAKGKFTDKAYQERLNELQNRITSMFKVHTQLHKQNDVTLIVAKPYLEGLVENVRQTHGRDGITLQIKVEDDEILLSDKAIPMGIMLNEFVTNSYKHAFEKNHGLISISLSSDATNYYLLLQDDGKGLSEDFDIDNLTTFGLEIIKILTEQHKGTFELQGSNGVIINISLPKQVTS